MTDFDFSPAPLPPDDELLAMLRGDLGGLEPVPRMVDVSTRNLAARDQSDDRLCVVPLPSGLAVVEADGAGGMGGAAEAAECAAHLVAEKAETLSSSLECARLIRAIDRVLADRGSGQTTLAVAILRGEELFGAAVGDSEVWTVVGQHYIRLTEGTARKPLVGSGHAVPRQFDGVLVGALLVGSDGLFKYATPEGIVLAVQEEEVECAADRLVELVRLKGGRLQDDVSFALAKPPRPV